MSSTPPEQQPVAPQQQQPFAPQPPIAPQQQLTPQQPFAPQPPYVSPQQFGGAPAGWVQPYPEQPPRPRTLGIAAMVIALAVTLLSIVASVIVGLSVAPLAQHTSTSFRFDSSSLTPEQAEAFVPTAALMGVQLLGGTILGIVALVLGIVAVATKRGRPFGVVAIIAAVVAPIVSFIVYTALVAVGA